MATSPGSSLVILRLVIGVSVWLMPNVTAKLFGLDPKGNPQASYLGRLFGIRDVALAGFVTQSAGPSKKLAWQLGILCDVVRRRCGRGSPAATARCPSTPP